MLLLVVFSACGGKRTDSRGQFLQPTFAVMAKGILGKGGSFVTPPLEDCLTGLTALLPDGRHLGKGNFSWTFYVNDILQSLRRKSAE